LLRYAYRGTDPMHHENVGLRAAMQRKLPLVYFHGLVPNEYLAAFPVFIVMDEPTHLFFGVAVDDARCIGLALRRDAPAEAVAESGDEPRRAYITGVFRRRVHQQSFRARVLRAYRERCAFCRLRHTELLDAAHITADIDPEGEPVIPNGLALCKLHHAAFDRHFLTVRPDYIIEVRRDVLEEEDGPMLLHGLKGMHMQRIHLPVSHSQHPDPARLARRYERFQAARG
jgi:putative restriction endonuclease